MLGRASSLLWTLNLNVGKTPNRSAKAFSLTPCCGKFARYINEWSQLEGGLSIPEFVNHPGEFVVI